MYRKAPEPSSTDFAEGTDGEGAIVSVTVEVVGPALAAETPDDPAGDAVSTVLGSPHADSPTAVRQSNTPRKPVFPMRRTLLQVAAVVQRA